MKAENINLKEMIDSILASRKYRGLGLNPKTIEDIIRHEAPKHNSWKHLRKSVRRKLHNVVAPYLGELDYDALSKELVHIKDPSPDSATIRTFCRKVLSRHASTAERLPYMSEFYARLFVKIGKPTVLLDLACGLHPFAFPWMGLPRSIDYYAYDIVQPRIDFINLFFKTIDLKPLAENRDILVNPPQIHADLGILFKEAHRMEKRRSGCNRELWSNLNLDLLAVSLPTQDLSGTHNLINQHRSLIHENLPAHISVEELLFEDEIIFMINRLEKQINHV